MNNDWFRTQWLSKPIAESAEERATRIFTNEYRILNFRINPGQYEYANSYSVGRYTYPVREPTVDLEIGQDNMKQLMSDAELGREMRELSQVLKQKNPAVLAAWAELQTLISLTR